MNRIRISVKGTVADAETELSQRGVAATLASVSSHGTYWEVSPDVRAKVVAWFCEPSTCGPGGFPPGTLLHHS